MSNKMTFKGSNAELNKFKTNIFIFSFFANRKYLPSQ